MDCQKKKKIENWGMGATWFRICKYLSELNRKTLILFMEKDGQTFGAPDIDLAKMTGLHNIIKRQTFHVILQAA